MNTSTQKMKTFIATLFFCLVCLTSLFAGNYTWNGATSTAWATNTNWTPNGVPSTNDTVTIVTGSNNVYLTTATTVKVMTMTSGTLDLQSSPLTITSTCNFNAGAINNGKLTAYGTAVLTFKGTQFGAKVTATGNSILLNGSVFSDSLFVIKKGSSNDNGKGGNTFHGVVQLVDSGTGSIVLADSFPDTFNSTLSIRNTSTGTVYIAHRATGTQFNGDVTISGSNVYSNYYGTATFSGNIILDRETGNMFFGTSTGSCTQVHGKKISISSKGISSGRIGLRNFTSLDSSSTINLSVTGSARLHFNEGSTFHDTLIASAPQILLNGTKFRNVSSFTNTTGGIASSGGCYFAKAMTFVSNSSTSAVIALASTNTDTFAVASTFENTSGTLTINKGLFIGKSTIKNNTSTGEGVFIATTGNCTFKDTLYIYKFGSTGVRFGSSGGTTVIDSNGTFVSEPGAGGVAFMQNVTKLSSSTMTMEESPTTLTLTSGNNFNGNFYFHGESVASTGTTFNSAATLKLHATATVTFGGGNIFNGTTIIQDSSSTAHNTYLANSIADDFNADVTFIQKGTGVTLYPAYTKNSTFSGNITTDGTSSMQLGGNGGKVILDGTTAQSINRGTTSLFPTIKKLQVNKASNSLTLNSPLTVSDSLQLTNGRINTDTTNLLSISHGGKLIGGSDSTYINGPLKKTGNAAFTFAVGSASLDNPYHPIEITAPTSSTDAYTAKYFPIAQTIGTAIDSTIDNLNSRQYWNLIRNSGTSKVKVKLSWNNDSCETISPTNFRVTGWNGAMWEDLGNAATSGDSIFGTVQSGDSLNSISSLTLAFFRCSSFRKSMSKNDITCQGDVDGSAEIRLTGGTPPYNYSWSSAMGDQPHTPRILFAGEFFVNVTDSLNCSLTDSVTILEPEKMVVSFVSSSSTCGDSSGSAIVTVTGGIGSLKNYFWSETRVENDTLLNVPAGDYTILVTDSSGCSLFGSVQINNSDGPTISVVTDTLITCYGDRGGYAEISVTGDSPFSYLWSSSPNDTSTFISNVFAGMYTVKVIDSLGCISYQSIEIEQPDTFQVDITVTDATCSLNNDGMVEATVHGGAAPYNYLWYSSIGINNDSLLNRPSGIDTLLVTDVNGCNRTAVFEILNSGGFSLTTTILNQETCFNDGIASAKVDVSGGTAPFTYLWYPNGGSNDTATGLISNFYKVTVIDSDGCRNVSSFFIPGPDNISIEIHKTLPTNDFEDDGFAEAVVIGGVAPYTYNWNSGSSSYKAFNLNLENDTVIVQDANGCIDSAFYRIRPQSIVLGACSYTNTPDDVSSCTFTPPPVTSTIQMDILDFGADGTDIYSDECAFELAAQYFSSLDSAIIKILFISKGTYYIGKQDEAVGLYWLSGHNVLNFSNVRNLTIQGEVDQHNTPISILKLNPCLKYGVFNPTTGQRHIGYQYVVPQLDPVLAAATISSSNYNICATIGNMIYLNYCNRITIRDLELDGNISETVIGGGFTEGIQQLEYTGIGMNSARNVIVDNIYLHHFGYDGLTIRDSYCPNDPFIDLNAVGLNLRLSNSKFTYNSRNNVTWAGGYKLTAVNCLFNYAGQGRYYSKPGAGFDIEYEDFSGAYGYPNSNGSFYDCHFEYNHTYGLINDVGPILFRPNYPPTRNMFFKRCSFIGDDYCMQNTGKQVVFDECTFVGSVASHYGEPTSFHNSRVRRDQTIFRDSRFIEFWNVPGVGMRSFQKTLDDNLICPSLGHGYLLNAQGSRTEFLRSYVVTNYSMRGAYMRTNPYGINRQWWNKFQFNQMNFYNFGLNECSCENGSDLSVFENVNLSISEGPSAHWIRYLYYRNPGIGCIGFQYGSSFDLLTSSSFDLVTTLPILPIPSFQTAAFNPAGFYPAYSKFVQPLPSDRLEWADLFSYNALNPSYDTYMDLTPMCIDPPERKNHVQNEINKSLDLTLFPIPSQDFVTITGQEGSFITIKTLLGETIKKLILESKRFTIQVDNLKCGLYLVSDEEGNVSKLIISR